MRAKTRSVLDVLAIILSWANRTNAAETLRTTIGEYRILYNYRLHNRVFPRDSSGGGRGSARLYNLGRDDGHDGVQQRQARAIAFYTQLVRIRDAAAAGIRDHDARVGPGRQERAHVSRGLLIDADDVAVVGQWHVADPAADMRRKIDPALLHHHDRTTVRRRADCFAPNACALHDERLSQVLLQQRLHHGAAASVADAHTEDFATHGDAIVTGAAAGVAPAWR